MSGKDNCYDNAPLEETHVQVILCRTIPTRDLGLAIRDRLGHAAGEQDHSGLTCSRSPSPDYHKQKPCEYNHQHTASDDATDHHWRYWTGERL